MQIVIDVPDTIAPEERDLIPQVIRDALGEFVAARAPSARYVAKRFAEHDENFREQKVKEVRAMMRVANTIKTSAQIGDL